jgi:hypothetical protein
VVTARDLTKPSAPLAPEIALAVLRATRRRVLGAQWGDLDDPASLRQAATDLQDMAIDLQTAADALAERSGLGHYIELRRDILKVLDDGAVSAHDWRDPLRKSLRELVEHLDRVLQHVDNLEAYPIALQLLAAVGVTWAIVEQGALPAGYHCASCDGHSCDEVPDAPQ